MDENMRAMQGENNADPRQAELESAYRIFVRHWMIENSEGDDLDQLRIDLRDLHTMSLDDLKGYAQNYFADQIGTLEAEAEGPENLVDPDPDDARVRKWYLEEGFYEENRQREQIEREKQYQPGEIDYVPEVSEPEIDEWEVEEALRQVREAEQRAREEAEQRQAQEREKEARKIQLENAKRHYREEHPDELVNGEIPENVSDETVLEWYKSEVEAARRAYVMDGAGPDAPIEQLLEECKRVMPDDEKFWQDHYDEYVRKPRAERNALMDAFTEYIIDHTNIEGTELPEELAELTTLEAMREYAAKKFNIDDAGVQEWLRERPEPEAAGQPLDESSIYEDEIQEEAPVEAAAQPNNEPVIQPEAPKAPEMPEEPKAPEVPEAPKAPVNESGSAPVKAEVAEQQDEVPGDDEPQAERKERGWTLEELGIVDDDEPEEELEIQTLEDLELADDNEPEVKQETEEPAKEEPVNEEPAPEKAPEEAEIDDLLIDAEIDAEEPEVPLDEEPEVPVDNEPEEAEIDDLPIEEEIDAEEPEVPLDEEPEVPVDGIEDEAPAQTAAEAPTQPTPQTPINTAIYNQMIRELRDDLKSTNSIFSSDSKEFTAMVGYLDAICGMEPLNERQLREAFNAIQVGVDAYQKHAQKHPRPEDNWRRNTRLGVMEKLSELGDNFKARVSDPKAPYIEKAQGEMTEAVKSFVMRSKHKPEEVAKAFVKSKAYKKKLNSLSTYKLDQLAKDPKAAKKTTWEIIETSYKEKKASPTAAKSDKQMQVWFRNPG